MILLFIIWYILGVIGGLMLSYYDNNVKEITVMDLLMSITFGGICGVAALFMALMEYSKNGPDDNFLNKKIF